VRGDDRAWQTKVLEGQIAKAVQRFVDISRAALAHFVQQRFNVCTIHQFLPFQRLPAA
jgi:hypothetical protein